MLVQTSPMPLRIHHQTKGIKVKVYIGIFDYADGEYLFVRRTLAEAKQAMRERYGDVTFGWHNLRQVHGVYRNKKLLAYIREETI